MHMIVGLAMGATVTIGQAVSVIVSLIVILKNGIPVALQDGFIQIAFIVITIITVCFGIIAAVIMQTFLHNGDPFCQDTWCISDSHTVSDNTFTYETGCSSRNPVFCTYLYDYL